VVTARYAESDTSDVREGAASRVVHAGSQLLLLRLELWAAQARVMARSGVVLALGTFAALAGWLFCAAAVVNALAEQMSRPLAQSLVGVTHIAAGLLLLRWSRRTAQPLRVRP
jgi:hypothetical protein